MYSAESSYPASSYLFVASSIASVIIASASADSALSVPPVSMIDWSVNVAVEGIVSDIVNVKKLDSISSI